MVSDSPLIFAPLFRSYIWGGTRLKSVLHKPVPDDGIWAESWEIVDHGKDQSIVSEGEWAGRSLRELIELHPEAMLGNGASSTSGFPLLLKYLDCQRVLSVQVHPDDTYAKKMTPPDLGKTEAWYVIDATADALLYAGLKPSVTSGDLKQAVERGESDQCLHSFHPKPGDCVFIPAGTLHALGAGLIVAEIQQASDTTFRLFDWNRVDKDGQPRTLHIAQALDVTDFARGPVDAVKLTSSELEGQRLLVDCDKFRLFEIHSSTAIAQDGQFKIVTVVKGGCELQWTNGKRSLSLGQTALLPAACQPVQLQVQLGSTVLMATGPQPNGTVD
jgi:mannose-6-phosphate isomerase